MIHPKFMTFVDSKMMLYQFLLRAVENDKT